MTERERAWLATRAAWAELKEAQDAVNRCRAGGAIPGFELRAVWDGAYMRYINSLGAWRRNAGVEMHQPEQS